MKRSMRRRNPPRFSGQGLVGLRGPGRAMLAEQGEWRRSDEGEPSSRTNLPSNVLGFCSGKRDRLKELGGLIRLYVLTNSPPCARMYMRLTKERIAYGRRSGQFRHE